MAKCIDGDSVRQTRLSQPLDVCHVQVRGPVLIAVLQYALSGYSSSVQHQGTCDRMMLLIKRLLPDACSANVGQSSLFVDKFRILEMDATRAAPECRMHPRIRRADCVP